MAAAAANRFQNHHHQQRQVLLSGKTLYFVGRVLRVAMPSVDTPKADVEQEAGA
jgi:hypothetical protein